MMDGILVYIHYQPNKLEWQNVGNKNRFALAWLNGNTRKQTEPHKLGKLDKTIEGSRLYVTTRWKVGSGGEY